MRLLTDAELRALVRLLDEEGESLAIVREHLLRAGSSALPYLEEAMRASSDLVRQRAREIASRLRYNALREDFARFAALPDGKMSLEHGAYLVAQYAYPDLKWDRYAAELDRIAGEIGAALRDEMYMEEVIDCINERLFDREGFRPDNRRFYDPENSYINRVIERRVGIPISLSVIYLLIAQRLDLPISGVAVPGHFLVRYDGPYQTLWIDPYNLGAILDRDDCEELLRSMGYPVLEEYLRPCTTRQIIARMLNNLSKVFDRSGEAERAQDVRALARLLLE